MEQLIVSLLGAFGGRTGSAGSSDDEVGIPPGEVPTSLS